MLNSQHNCACRELPTLLSTDPFVLSGAKGPKSGGIIIAAHHMPTR